MKKTRSSPERLTETQRDLVASVVPLCRSVANRTYAGMAEPLGVTPEDWFQTACERACELVRYYDASKGGWVPYASHWLKVHMANEVRPQWFRRQHLEYRLGLSLDFEGEEGYAPMKESVGDRPARVCWPESVWERALSSLPGTQREALRSVFMDGRTFSQTARDLGVSRQAVWNRVAEALKKLGADPYVKGLAEESGLFSEVC